MQTTQFQKLSLTLSLALCLGVAAAADQTAKRAMLKEGKMMIVQDGKTIHMEKNVLLPHDIKVTTNGTFTVNNVGVFGVVMSTPVINQPQAAILAMNALVKRPVVVDDAIAIRAMMNLCLSFDHRIVDGLIAGRFLERVIENIRALDPSNL